MRDKDCIAPSVHESQIIFIIWNAQSDKFNLHFNPSGCLWTICASTGVNESEEEAPTSTIRKHTSLTDLVRRSRCLELTSLQMALEERGCFISLNCCSSVLTSFLFLASLVGGTKSQGDGSGERRTWMLLLGPLGSLDWLALMRANALVAPFEGLSPIA